MRIVFFPQKFLIFCYFVLKKVGMPITNLFNMSKNFLNRKSHIQVIFYLFSFVFPWDMGVHFQGPLLSGMSEMYSTCYERYLQNVKTNRLFITLTLFKS